MLTKIINFFKSSLEPYQGSSETFIEISKTIKDEFIKENVNISRILSLLTVLESLAITQGDGDIIKQYQTQFRKQLDRMK